MIVYVLVIMTWMDGVRDHDALIIQPTGTPRTHCQAQADRYPKKPLPAGWSQTAKCFVSVVRNAT